MIRYVQGMAFNTTVNELTDAGANALVSNQMTRHRGRSPVDVKLDGLRLLPCRQAAGERTNRSSLHLRNASTRQAISAPCDTVLQGERQYGFGRGRGDRIPAGTAVRPDPRRAFVQHRRPLARRGVLTFKSNPALLNQEPSL